jgi:hypothetical protein
MGPTVKLGLVSQLMTDLNHNNTAYQVGGVGSADQQGAP